MQIENKKPLIVHFSQSDLLNASRIFKEAKSISEVFKDHKIYLLGFWRKGLEEQNDINENVTIIRVKTFFKFRPKNQFTRICLMVEYFVRIITLFRRKDIVVVQPHSVETLPLAVIFKIFIKKNVKIVYDAHELETEKSKKPYMNLVYKLIEKILIKYPDSILVVGDKIKDHYQMIYGDLQNIAVIRNIPAINQNEVMPKESFLKNKFGLSSRDILFIYQGALEKNRGIEVLLRVFSQVKDKHVVFMGFGSMENMIKEFSLDNKNIHFHPAISPRDVLSYTSGADVGFSILDNSCLNHYYCLPNKFFEYILAGIPVIASNFPELAKIIDDYGLGWKVLPNEKNVFTLINNINKQDILSKRQHAVAARSMFNWNQEARKLIDTYNNLIAIKNT